MAARTSDEIYEAISELRERVTRLEERVDILASELQEIHGMKSDLAAVKQRVEDIDRKIDDFKQILLRQQVANHRLLKWVLALVGMVLSFVAAMMGIRWAP